MFLAQYQNQMPKSLPILAALKQAVSVQRLFHFGPCVTLCDPVRHCVWASYYTHEDSSAIIIGPCPVPGRAAVLINLGWTPTTLTSLKGNELKSAGKIVICGFPV